MKTKCRKLPNSLLQSSVSITEKCHPFLFLVIDFPSHVGHFHTILAGPA